MKTRIKVITLGCSKNTVDTEHLLASLPEEEFMIVDSSAVFSDVMLLNTCGFIGDAKQESIEAILDAVECKKRGETSRVVVFGCLSQRYPGELREEIPEVDAFFGARDLAPVLEYLGAGELKKTARYIPEHKGYAYLKISEGCDRRCSYCAIPFIRGAHRSVPMEEILQEARGLAATGVRELILIAQDSTYYGLDLYGKRCIAPLVRQLSGIPGIEWIRIHYSYPDDFPEDLLEEMASNPKVCKYLDIPLQHIADNVLSKMRRNVTSEWTRNLVVRMREKVPGVVLRTTMIVGHPGEGEQEFGELLQFVREGAFQRLGAFTYSEEDGTYGQKHYSDDIPQEEKNRRYDALMSIQKEISLAYNLSRVGTVERVMVDDCVDGTLVCRSQYESPEVDGEILVKGEARIGDFINVRIVEADDYDLAAEII